MYPYTICICTVLTTKLPPNMNTFTVLQRQPFHRAKRKLHPTLTAVIDRQAPIPRRLPGRQPLPEIAVTDTALGTRTHAYEIPGLGMLQNSYPSVESALPGTREGLDMQETSGLRWTTQRTPPYPLRLRWGVQDVGIHHHAVDTSGCIIRSNGLVQTSSIVAVDTGAISECAGGYQASVPKSR